MMESLESRHRAFHSCFSSPDGKKVLEILIQDFQERPLFDSDALRMAYQTGQFELVQYLKDMSKGNLNE